MVNNNRIENEMKIISIKKIREAQVKEDSLPDVDCDFQQAERHWVKHYLENKYGKNNVCSLATYGRLQLRAAIKDISKVKNLGFEFVNNITRSIYGNQWEDLIEAISKNEDVKHFIEDYPDIMNIVERCLGQVRHSSIHPAGVIISPQYKIVNDKKIKSTLDDFIPVKLMSSKDNINKELVSEWEGYYVERRGLLKIDILGIKQLDIFKYISSLIKKNYNKEINFSEIPLDDDKVFEKFRLGDTEGVFQFKSNLQKDYQRKLQADNIEHLIAANALLRPGAMISNAHTDYVDIKSGKKAPQYDKGLESVTKETLGLYIYQEQIMNAMVVGGGLSLAEADAVRTYIKHFDKEKMATFKNKFILGIKRLHNYNDKEALVVWEKLMAFSSYGFNKAHSCSYAILGYQCQYLKTYYSKEFWIANLEYADEDDRVEYINRILTSYSNLVSIKFPDINESSVRFSLVKSKIVWGLTHIKGVGEKASVAILKARSKEDFKSLKDFFDKVEKRIVNKRVFLSLIYSGTFDSFYDIEKPIERFKIISDYYKIRKEKESLKIEQEDFYDFEYKRLLGINIIDWDTLISKNKKIDINKYSSLEELDNIPDGSNILVAGLVIKFFEQEYKNKKGFYGRVNLQQNGFECDLMIWDLVWQQVKDKLKIGKRIAFFGRKEFDKKYFNKNVIYSIDNESKIITLK